MKAFMNPEIEIENFEIADVITTSGDDVFVPGENESGMT